MKFKETPNRSLVKSITFRVLVICSDLVVIYILTHQVSTTIAVTLFTNVASTMFYFLHERIWNAIAWGRQKAR